MRNGCTRNFVLLQANRFITTAAVSSAQEIATTTIGVEIVPEIMVVDGGSIYVALYV